MVGIKTIFGLFAGSTMKAEKKQIKRPWLDSKVRYNNNVLYCNRIGLVAKTYQPTKPTCTAVISF